MRVVSYCSVLVALVVPAGSVISAGPVTTCTLVDEMVDMVGLGDFPQPAYKTVQFSSHDHRSTLPGGPNWFANSDGFGREPVPNFEAVLQPPNEKGIGRYLVCDVHGPGAIVRTWTAAIKGHIRMVLDDSHQPIFDGPAQQFFQAIYEPYAKAAGMANDVFDGTFRQRDACYFPIAFSRRCRIEWTGNIQQIHFYEVQIRCYDSAAKIQTFTPNDLKTWGGTIRRVARLLKDPDGQWQYQSGQERQAVDVSLEPKSSQQVVRVNGPTAIERLAIRLQAKDLNQALRQTVLQITFDGHQDAQIQCPVGDFFGAAPGINPYNAVPFTVRPDGTMISRFVMPFAKSCEIRLTNRSSESVHATLAYLPMEYDWKAGRSMHFRARWRVDHGLVSAGGAGAQDLPFVVARGKGVYVGTAIMMLNPNPVPTPAGNWWGEGDEKVFFDDDRQPSIFGTGSEDYFNYSWSSPDIFLYAYCGQPRNDGPANRGFVVNHRWHVLDALPFQKQLSFYMELFSHERNPAFSYARIGYHYGLPGMVDDFVRLTDEDVRVLHLPDWQPAARGAARNSEFYQAETILSDSADTTVPQGELWAGQKLLQWQPTTSSSRLEFDLPVKETGRYVIHITAAETPESGTLSATLDGKPLGFATATGTILLRTKYRTQLRNFSTHLLQLAKGKHRLTLQLEKADTNSTKSTRIGIDFIWVQKR